MRLSVNFFPVGAKHETGYWTNGFTTIEEASNIINDLLGGIIFPTLEITWPPSWFRELAIELVDMDLPCRVDVIPHKSTIKVFMDEGINAEGEFVYRKMGSDRIRSEIASVVMGWIDENRGQLIPEDREEIEKKCERYLISEE